ncbi:MAG TPA: hypothetical protein VHU19_03945 [Pyrinomonadaceae bacterium]|jgi:hypothetical protein|nr:hypothetical protein [Pyrinomonadaceae bacterium]
MKIRNLARPLVALALTLSLGCAALADTIHMKDGQVIRGQIVSFRDQQFTVLIGAGARGRRSQVTVYMEDVDSIEFDSAGGADNSSARSDNGYTPAPVETSRTQPAPRQAEPRQTEPRQSSNPPTLGGIGNTSPPSPGGRTNNGANNSVGGTTQTAPASGGDSPFFPVRVRVHADNTANGWTDSGLMVRKGQRLRVTATGRVSLGQGRFSTPTGLPRVVDTEKLMRNEPTGELIAVVGDDNDDFIAVGASREFYAPRDGRLFLGVNEGNLDDNTGSYDVVIEVEPVTSGGH